MEGTAVCRDVERMLLVRIFGKCQHAIRVLIECLLFRDWWLFLLLLDLGFHCVIALVEDLLYSSIPYHEVVLILVDEAQKVNQ